MATMMDDDTLLYRKYGTRSQAKHYCNRLRMLGFEAHTILYEGSNMIWVQGLQDSRKLLELIEKEETLVDWHENLNFAIQVCATAHGGCEKCSQVKECKEFFDQRIDAAPSGVWTENVYSKILREWKFWFSKQQITNYIVVK